MSNPTERRLVLEKRSRFLCLSMFMAVCAFGAGILTLKYSGLMDDGSRFLLFVLAAGIGATFLLSVRSMKSLRNVDGERMKLANQQMAAAFNRLPTISRKPPFRNRQIAI